MSRKHVHPDRLPTSAQVSAIDDPVLLGALADDIERVCTQIETDLEFRTDEPWASRARHALSIHRHALKRVSRRVRALAAGAPEETGLRSKEETHPLTLEVLAQRPSIDVAKLETVEAVDEQLAWLAARIGAVADDRSDEIGLLAGDRDEGFLAATGSMLREMRGLRQELQNQRGRISKAVKAIAHKTVDRSRERLFIEAAREIIDRATYLAIWDRVDQLQELESRA